MAAVAAEPGAAEVPTTNTDEGAPEPAPSGPGLTGAPPEGDGQRESGPEPELELPRGQDGGEVEQRRHVRPELLQTEAGTEPGPADPSGPAETAVCDHHLPGDIISSDRLCVAVPGDPEGGGNASRSLPEPEPSAVFLLSPPGPQGPGPEAGLSLEEPAEPTTNVTTDWTENAGDRGYTAPVRPELRPGPAAMMDRLSVPDDLDPGPGRSLSRAPQSRLMEKPAGEDFSGPEPGPGPEQDLSPGSEVRVSLDHVIDDALVVSFRRGGQVFTGVLMDASKRFGPYGIPVTVFPRRDDQSRPQTFVAPPPVPAVDPFSKQEEVAVSPPPPDPWTSKPPPLFQEGAPYPPPLFIRDTYNQALPQPLPRKIKRPKRRYRCEEPTSIMNAIKLRPRQVLCDKCKGVVASGGHRESRRGPSDLRSEEGSRRRRAVEGPISSEVKRLRSDDKGGRPAADRRSSSGIRVSPSSSSRRVLRGVAPPSPSPGHMCLKLNSKKVLAKASAVDCSKARQVLKKLVRISPPPPHRRPKDQNQNQIQGQSPSEDRPKAVTRAAALQNHNQKVHFTRRLQHLSGAAVSSHTPLPPRMRLKPQRYRTDDSQAPPSPPKQSARSPPSKPALSPAPTLTPEPPTAPPPPSPPPSCAASVAVDTQEVQEEGAEPEVEAPPPCSSTSSSLDSAHSECSSTETFDLPPPGDLLSPSPALPPPPSSITPPPQADGEETQAGVGGGGEEEEEEGSDLKRRRKSSTSSCSSSSSSSSSVFSKSVSKCSLPDGRTVCAGDIVWAKIYGFPWWPARVLGITVARRGDTGLAVRQEARVSWFGSPTTSFLPLAQLSPFLETFQSRFDRKRKGPYRRAIAEAASAAKQLTPEVRALLTQFET